VTAVPQPAVSIDGIVIKFGDFTAVNGVSFDVARGEVFGLLGPNGSGKTTLIRALCGLIPITEGGGRLLGYDVTKDVEAVRARVGYMSQKFSLYADLTAQENMDFYSGVYGLSREDAKVRQEELVTLTGLGPYLNRRSAKLSGGWKQRLALVCALIHGPEVVFLDEPTAGVDPVARRDLWDLLFRLSADGIALFVTTHYMDEAERCARVGYLYMSNLLAIGTPDELKLWPGVTPDGYTRWEIAGAKIGASALLDQLRGNSNVLEATIFGQTVRALVKTTTMPEDLGLSADSVKPTVPTLEDVFVTLSKAKQTDAENEKKK
jgi:ABC-2 type transport system ATP-binding protein